MSDVPEAAATNPIAIAPQKSLTVTRTRNCVSEIRAKRIVTIELEKSHEDNNLFELIDNGAQARFTLRF